MEARIIDRVPQAAFMSQNDNRICFIERFPGLVTGFTNYVGRNPLTTVDGRARINLLRANCESFQDRIRQMQDHQAVCWLLDIRAIDRLAGYHTFRLLQVGLDGVLIPGSEWTFQVESHVFDDLPIGRFLDTVGGDAVACGQLIGICGETMTNGRTIYNNLRRFLHDNTRMQLFVRLKSMLRINSLNFGDRPNAVMDGLFAQQRRVPEQIPEQVRDFFANMPQNLIVPANAAEWQNPLQDTTIEWRHMPAHTPADVRHLDANPVQINTEEEPIRAEELPFQPITTGTIPFTTHRIRLETTPAEDIIVSAVPDPDSTEAIVERQKRKIEEAMKSKD